MRVVSLKHDQANNFQNLGDTYLGLRTESNRFRINPCFNVDANAKICLFADSTWPVVRNRARSEMNTPRPQHLAQPDAKWESTAASEGRLLTGSSEADCTSHYIWSDTIARS
jgi:hypothetical protein